MHGRTIFIPEKLYGQGQINHDPDFNNTRRICRKIESHRKITQWVHLCKGNKRNVWNPPSRTDRTRRPGKTPREVWIPHMKQKTRTTETQYSANKLYLGS